jgi:hypothetical protein
MFSSLIKLLRPHDTLASNYCKHIDSGAGIGNAPAPSSKFFSTRKKSLNTLFNMRVMMPPFFGSHLAAPKHG